jgi:hypothetical protein
MEGDALKPTAQGIWTGDRHRLAGQDEEGGLEGILGGVLVSQDAKTHVEDQGLIADDDLAERAFIAVFNEAAQQRVYGRVVVLRHSQQPTNVAQLF